MLTMKNKSVAIKSIAVKHPSRYYTNEMSPYSDIPNVPVFWWRLWGMEGRYLMDRKSGETVESLALAAAKEAIELAGKTAEDVDLILGTTCCVSGWSEDPYKIYPGLSHTLKNKLGCKSSCVTVEINQACISFIVSLEIAASYIKAGVYKNILICVSESFSSQMDFTDTSSTLFADGSAAVLVGEGDEDEDLLSSAYHSDSTHCDLATIQWRYPNKDLSLCKPEDLRSYFTLKDGSAQKMQTFVPFKVPEMVQQALRKIQLTTNDIEYFIFHQPSTLIINTWADGLKVGKDRYLVTVDKFSCLASVSTPLTLYEALKQNKIKNKIVIAGAGTGWGFCAQVWKMNKINFN
jgi:3-oxoacyl-[acyl-carrier-protein] synthase III